MQNHVIYRLFWFGENFMDLNALKEIIEANPELRNLTLEEEANR